MRNPEAIRNAADLRLEFDQGFAQPASVARDDAVSFIGLEIDGDAYALRVGDISGLFVDRRIVGLPGPLPELLGIAGLRGGIVAVYSVRRLLGYEEAGGAAPRWLAHAGKGPSLGLAFHDFGGHFRVPKASVLPSSEGSRPHVFEAVLGDDRRWGVIDIASVLTTVRRRNDLFAKEP